MHGCKRAVDYAPGVKLFEMIADSHADAIVLTKRCYIYPYLAQLADIGTMERPKGRYFQSEPSGIEHGVVELHHRGIEEAGGVLDARRQAPGGFAAHLLCSHPQPAVGHHAAGLAAIDAEANTVR